jgi:hypothetical protein
MKKISVIGAKYIIGCFVDILIYADADSILGWNYLID